MVHIKVIYVLLMASVIACSCDDNLISALRSAGSNEKELEAVLDHYQRSGDYEKLRAAKFIISNAQFHSTLRGDIEYYYECAHQLLNRVYVEDTVLDSLRHLSESCSAGVFSRPDNQVLTADYLIRNIDAAFYEWRNGEWCRHLGFEDFCEIILPYRCSPISQISNWREDYRPIAYGDLDYYSLCQDFMWDAREPLSRINTELKRTVLGQERIDTPHGYPIPIYEDFIKLPGVTCEEACEIGTMVMRSKGFPVTIDYSPQWADRMLGHTWCTLLNIRGKNIMFNPFESNPYYPHFPYLKFPKIFRYTFSVNREYLHLIRHDKIRNLQPSLCFKDVTDEYYQTHDLKIRLLRNRGRKYVYLGLFNCYNWNPIFWGRASGCTVTFRNVGTNFIGIVLEYAEGRYRAISKPFEVDVRGNVRYIGSDTKETIDFEMYRKCPMFQHVFRQEKTLHGGLIEASNSKDFRESEIVARLPLWEIQSGKVSITQSQPYRYWRFTAGDGNVCDMAELFFYEKSGKRIIPKAWNYDEGYRKMNDGDALTYYTSKGMEYHGCYGLGVERVLDHISFIRRGDGNDIFPGDAYELYYWDNGQMVLFDMWKADDISHPVKGIPADRLYYIKCTSRGTQQRIFEYDREKAKIIWH